MSTLNHPQVQSARAYAIEAHGAQLRKYTGEPYWHHPEAVAKIVAETGASHEVVAAAYLHDVIEDTGRTYSDILERFGAKVADLVLEVTDISRPEDGNRAHRKALDLAHLSGASPEGQTIKLADLIDNTESIVTHDPHFAKVYLREKASVLAALRYGDRVLWTRASIVLRNGLAVIGGAA